MTNLTRFILSALNLLILSMSGYISIAQANTYDEEQIKQQSPRQPGKTQSPEINCLTFTSIQSEKNEDSYTEYSVSPAGDVNGDKIPDCMLGAPFTDHNAGRIYFIYGTEEGLPAQLNLENLASGQGTVIYGDSAIASYLGYSVKHIGDKNGDGLDDNVIHAYISTGDGPISYIVYGVKGGLPPAVYLNSLTPQPLSATLDYDDDFSKLFEVSSAGDMDGDGIEDTIERYDIDSSGKVYIADGVDEPLANAADTLPTNAYLEKQDFMCRRLWALISRWLPTRGAVTQTKVQSDKPSLTLLNAFREKCQQRKRNAPSLVNPWYRFKLDDLIEKVDQKIARSQPVNEHKLERYEQELAAIEEDFLISEDLPTRLNQDLQTSSILSSFEIKLNGSISIPMLSVRMPAVLK